MNPPWPAPGARKRPAVLDGLADGPLLFWCLCAMVLGLVALLAMLSAATGARWSAAWQEALAAAACVLLLPLPFHAVHRLAAQWRVWRCRVAPLASWQQAVRRHLRVLVMAWGLVALPLMVLLCLTGDSSHGLSAVVIAVAAAPALLGAVLGLGLLAAAGWAGMLAWPWGLAGGLVLCMVLAFGIEPLMALSTVIEALSGASSTVALVGALGLFGLMLCTAPLVLALLRERWVQGAPAAVEGAPAARFHSAWQSWTEPWRQIDARHGLPLVLLAPQWQHLGPSMSSLGGELSPSRLYFLWLLTLLSLFALRGGWPHWRVMLAPGGHFRHRLGLRIVLATWVSMCLLTTVLVVAGGVMCLLLPFLPAPPWQRLPGLLVSHGLPLACDFALAVALATWLRGGLGSQERAMWLLLSLAGLGVAVAITALLLGVVIPWRAGWWTIGTVHLAGQLVLAALFTALAQRAWARADLAEGARRRTADEADGRR